MRVLLWCVVTVIAACGGGGEGGDDDPDGGVSPSCQEAMLHDDLQWIETTVFARSCVFMSCHSGAATQANGLNLEPGQSHAELVGQPSIVAPTETLVVPGDPAASYLLVALGRNPGTLPMGGTMPLSSPPLCDQKIDAIERWIAAGALP
jgi:hypothetical protein